MIDIHSHVLPGVDDGSRNLEESLAMLQVAARSGTTDLVASPHSNLDYRWDPVRIEERFAELSAAAGETIRLHLGCDFHLYHDNIADALANPSKYTINHRNYLLVEFSDLLVPKNTGSTFAKMRDAGIVPIITHPERNPLLYRRLDEVAAWVAEGVLLQVTGQSLLGRFGTQARNIARDLISRRMVHFVASDAHDTEDRPPRLDLAYRHVADRYGAPMADALFLANPEAVLAGVALPPLPPPETASARKWYRFW